MAIASTLSGQVGFAVESVAGTRQAPTKWAEILSENLTFGRKTIRSAAIGGGGAHKKPYGLLGQVPAGTIAMEASAENIGNMLRLALGAPTTTGPVSTVYTHTFNWLLTVPLPTATFQVGRTSIDGTTRPFDFIGMMVNTWEMAITPDEYVKMSYDLVGRQGKTDQTLATPTWPTLTSWTSLNASLTVLGGTECFDNLTIKGDNKLDVSSVVCSGATAGVQRVRQAGGPMITGSIDQDFEDMALYNAFVAGTVGDISVVLDAGSTAQLTITGRVQFVEDSSPSLAGQEQIIKQSCPFAFVRDGANTDAQTFGVALKTTVATV